MTMVNMPPNLREKMELVCDESEAEAHQKNGRRVLVLPPGVQGRLSRVRQWILDNVQDSKVVLLDDDLKFYCRRDDDATKLRAPKDGELEQMFDAIDLMLNNFQMVGVASREGANRNTEALLHNTRIMRLMAFDFDFLRAKKLKFDRLTCMSDFDMTLQILRNGGENVILNSWAHNQDGSNASGGCSEYRTLDVLADSAYGLEVLHPDFVNVVEKETKAAWGGGARTDVRIAWKKAYEEGRSKR